eukprot:UN15333
MSVLLICVQLLIKRHWVNRSTIMIGT